MSGGEGFGKYFEMATRPDGAARLDEGDPGTAPVVRDADGAAIIIHAAADDDKARFIAEVEAYEAAL